MPALAQLDQVDTSTVRHDDNRMLADHVESDLTKRIRRDNRVWLVAFLAVLIGSGYLIWLLARQDEAAEKRRSVESAHQRRTPFPGELQYRASEAIRGRLNEMGIQGAWVRFVDREQIEVELPSSIDRSLVPRVRRAAREVTLEVVQREPQIAIYVARSPGLGARTEISP